ncbi:MAG: ABC transporter ATP-binding protein [Hungatella hathewayi]|nr:ABC transporter ATP-binding protein [Hungatella hathewayi]
MISSEMERKKQMKKEILLQTDKLCKTFSTGGLQQHVLKNLDLTIYKGDFTVIMGASGSGKSTLLYVLSGMDQPTLGTVKYGQMDITGLGVSEMAVFRRKNCGFVFQQIHLLDNMSVLDNVLVSGLLTSRDRKAVAARGKQLLSQVGILEADWGKFPAQLSGGEAQRVGIVRALMNEPNLVFADEPTGALNSNFSEQVLDALTGINKVGQSLVVVTHDIKTARRANRVIYLKDGMICGECELGTYEKHDRNRHEKLNAFLAEMGW